MQKDNQLTEINQMHEQELFKLAAKCDASADLEQVPTLTALYFLKSVSVSMGHTNLEKKIIFK